MQDENRRCTRTQTTSDRNIELNTINQINQEYRLTQSCSVQFFDLQCKSAFNHNNQKKERLNSRLRNSVTKRMSPSSNYLKPQGQNFGYPALIKELWNTDVKTWNCQLPKEMGILFYVQLIFRATGQIHWCSLQRVEDHTCMTSGCNR